MASRDAGIKAALDEAISLFRCEKDTDIEQFLHSKAVVYSDRGWCSVYLLLNDACLEDGILQIEAYFTLSHKSMIADHESMSKSAITRYGGIKSAKTLDFILIGQLGKHISVDRRSEITGSEILDNAFSIIQLACELIPCKYVLVECSDEKKVRNVYEQYGFSFFQKDGLNQYTKRI